MTMELTAIIMDSLNELIEEEECQLNRVIKSGAESFERRTFERVECQLKEAGLRKKALDILSRIRAQWKEFTDLDECLEDTLGAEYREKQFDKTVSYCTPELRLRTATNLLMSAVIKAGARSFESLRFERVQQLSRHAVNLQEFQARVEEVCGENGIKSAAEKILNLNAA